MDSLPSNPSDVFACCLIGEGVLLRQCAERLRERGHLVAAVVSSEPSVVRWCEEWSVKRIPASGKQLDFLANIPFDYLFSIVNHAVVQTELLKLARRGAINYHDSPLPRYAGFNVTSWAILQGETSHGVTWHEMAERVDAGRILKQRIFDIAPDDTAFSLAARCHAAALETFAELVEELGEGLVAPTDQLAEGRTYFSRHARPVSVLDWTRPAEELTRLVRALDLGPENSPLGTPKFRVNENYYLLLDAEVTRTPSWLPPSSVVSADDDAMCVATGSVDIRLSRVAELDGTNLTVAELVVANALRVESLLTPPPVDAIAAFDTVVAKHERSFIQRLVELSPATLPYARTSGLDAASVEELVTECPVLAGGTSAEGASGADFVASAFALFLGRLGIGDAFDVGFEPRLPRTAFDGIFVHQLPLRVVWNADLSFESAAAGVREKIEDLRQRQAFAVDVWPRQSALRELERFGFRRGYPVVIGLGAPETPLLPGTDIELSIAPSRLHWRFNRATLSAEVVRRIVEQFDAFMAEARRTPTAPVHRLPIMSAAERRLVLGEWNQTDRAVESLCVHQFFEQKARENPGAPAVVFRNQKLSYGELNARANELAHRLIHAGAGPDRLVGIYLDRSIEMLVAMVAVLKAGAAYVPLDPNYPAERLAWMLEDSKAALVVTDRRLHPSLPSHGATVMYVEDDASNGVALENPRTDVRPEHLAYVIFTSGSTGRPKGVMLEHRNVANFFVGMDERVGVPAPGDPEPTWLAVTSISFDIHVLELLWTLGRGFKIVLAEDQSAARVRSSLLQTRSMDFSLFYFASDAGGSSGERYRLLLEGAKFADDHDFAAVWTPERHFHAFGGLYPNPAVTSAALAAITRRIQIRAGSVVLPLHHPVRVAEEWSVVDNLSGGRVGLSFASGWHANDFAFAPGNYADRKEIMFRGIETIRKLWLGESVDAQSGDGKAIQIKIQPLPIRARPPIWITAAGSADTFRAAGEKGFNLLTNLLGQSIREVSEKITAYREAFRKAGHPGEGTVTVMVHTFVTTDATAARATVYEPFSAYLQSSFDLIKMAPWAFPAFKQPSKAASDDTALDPTSFSAEDLKALLDHAFDRYFESAGLFGTPDSCAQMVDRLREAGVNEIACLIDFGVDPEVVLSNLKHLSRLRENSNTAVPGVAMDEYSLAAQIREHGVTHLQCTPSLARMMIADPETFDAMKSLRTVLLGGEALPTALAQDLHQAFSGRLINMYGPTETTVWSTTFAVERGKAEITIGRPIANTEIYLLDAKMEPVPVGVPGELYIGGAGVARGYLFREELTRERFVDHPFKVGARLYRTGDLAKYSTSSNIEFLGRNDHQIKIRGFRIELGEIEAVLGKHPGVKEAVVVARDESGVAPELVAYWVPREAKTSGLTDDWHAIWDETYRQGDAPRSVENLNLAGWKSTYTGEAVPEADMREWVTHTVERIRELTPRRVLEIGCGTGLLLTRLAPGCESYTGVDFSETAIEHVRKEARRLGLANVTLVRASAHELPELGQFDTIVLNSIIQYFPDADYLRRVLDKLGTLVAPGGSVFVGDVRSLPLLPAFHASVELFQSPETRTVKEVRERILRRERQETELVLHPDFFREWAKQSGTLTSAATELKRGLADNEMTRFRYDVVLSAKVLEPTVADRAGATTFDAVRATLDDSALPICFRDIPNARLTSELATVEALAGAADSATVGDVRAELAAVNAGERPEPFWSLAPASRVRVDFAASGALDRFDVFVTAATGDVPRASAAAPSPAASRSNAPGLDAFANRPKPRASGTTSASLKEHVRELLPEYMVPTEFVSLERLPLTPNGKLDRKALPAPRAERQTSARAYVAAENDVEQVILSVWQELLNLEQLGATENFFDLGANSLLMVQANAQLKLRLDRSVSLLDMFRFSNARTLAAHLGRNRPVGDAPTPSQDRAQSRRDALSRQRATRASRVR